MTHAPAPRIVAHITRSSIKTELPTHLEATVVSALTAEYLKRWPELKAEKRIGAKSIMGLVIVNAALLDVFLAAELERPDAIKMITKINRAV